MAKINRVISNGKFVNFTHGLCRVTALTENMATHKVEIFSSVISVPDTGVTLPYDTILGRSREINDIFDATGSFAGSTTGNEVLVDKTQSITLADDYVYLSDDPASIAESKNMLISMLSGEMFKGPDGNIRKVIGTNGNVKRGKRAYSNLPFMELLREDGLLKVPQASDDSGNPLLIYNSRVTAYNNFSLCVMLEFITEFSSVEKQGYRFSYVLNSNILQNEQDDYNKFSMDAMFLCDYRSIDKFFVEGISAGYSTDKYVEMATAPTIDDSTKEITAITGITGTPVAGSVAIVYVATAGNSGYVIADHDGTNWIARSAVLADNGASMATAANAAACIIPIYDFNFETGDFEQV